MITKEEIIAASESLAVLQDNLNTVEEQYRTANNAFETERIAFNKMYKQFIFQQVGELGLADMTNKLSAKGITIQI